MEAGPPIETLDWFLNNYDITKTNLETAELYRNEYEKSERKTHNVKEKKK